MGSIIERTSKDDENDWNNHEIDEDEMMEMIEILIKTNIKFN